MKKSTQIKKRRRENQQIGKTLVSYVLKLLTKIS